MLKNLLVCAVFLVLTFGTPAREQQSSPDGASFASRTDFVVVPVVVTDSSGKHVTGLTKTDFHVFENGREQKIAQFEEVTAAGASLRTAPPVNGIYTNRVVSGEPTTALGIVLVDQLNTRTVSQYWAIRGVLSFLDKWKGQKGFPHPMMLATITTSGLQVVHAPTMNPAALADAIELVRARGLPRAETTAAASTTQPAERRPDGSVDPAPRPDGRGSFSSDGYNAEVAEARREADTLDEMARGEDVARHADSEADAQTTFWAMQGLANAVAGIPGRKALIWVADQFPFALHVESSSPQWDQRWEGGRPESSYVEKLRAETLAALDRAMISVYPVHAAGLSTPEYLGSAWAGKVTKGRFRLAEGSQGDQTSNARFVADQTGGVHCGNTSDIATCLQHTVEDSGHHYLLAYYPDPKPKSEGVRKIKVEVQREHVNIRARRQYYFGAQSVNASAAKGEIAIALKSTLLYTGLPILVRFQPVQAAAGGKRTAQFLLGVDGQALTIDAGHGNRVSLSLAVQAGRGDAVFQTIDTQLKPEKVGEIRSTRLTHGGQLDLAPGNYDVRFVVRDNLSGQLGSVVVPLKVN